MSDALKALRHLLAVNAVPETTAARIELGFCQAIGGDRHYIPKVPEFVREHRRSLIRAGMPARSARRRGFVDY